MSTEIKFPPLSCEGCLLGCDFCTPCTRCGKCIYGVGLIDGCHYDCFTPTEKFDFASGLKQHSAKYNKYKDKCNKYLYKK